MFTGRVALLSVWNDVSLIRETHQTYTASQDSWTIKLNQG